MNIPDNKVATLFSYLKNGLAEYYDDREATNIAQILFDHHLGYTRVDIVIKADETLSESEILDLHFSLKKLKAGEPIHYVIGECEFYGLRFSVDNSVLIPRPETEELVRWIIEENKKESLRILDIGTGSGCIPISLKSKLKGADVGASDVSKKALNVAMQNAKSNSVDVSFYHNDVLKDSLAMSKLDIIVSNPPYITESEASSMENRVADKEPKIALFVPDEDPLLFYKRICQLALEGLNSNGKIYFEVHEDYAKQVCDVLEAHSFVDIQCKQDLQGKERMVRAIKP